MKLQLTCLAAYALALSATDAAICTAGTEADAVVESVTKILVPSAIVCNVTDAANVETYYQLKPCGDADCLELLTTFVSVVPDCEDGDGVNIHKKMKTVIDTCTASEGSAPGPGPAPATTTAVPTKEAVAAPTPANAAGAATFAVTSVAVSAIAWLAMA